MRVTVGTFNLNNLFGRWNLYVDVPASRPERLRLAPAATDEPAPLSARSIPTRKSPPRDWLEPAPDAPLPDDGRRQLDLEPGTPERAPSRPDVQVTINGTLLPSGEIRWRTNPYSGRAIYRKPERARATLATRIAQMNVDVLAVQEVEDIVALEDFARSNTMRQLGYRHVVLVEGNDKRLIDVGVLSRLPIGKVTSWRYKTYGDLEGGPVFSRDLLEVDILAAANRKKVLCTMYVTHLKSQLARNDAQRSAADRRRSQQAETIRAILDARRRGRYIVVGDMNDTPESAPLASFAQWELVNGLSDPVEVGGPYPRSDPYQPTTTAWTHRYKAAGPPRYDLYDQIWLSRDLASRQTGSWILRRTKRMGDASDHDPAWVSLELD